MNQIINYQKSRNLLLVQVAQLNLFLQQVPEKVWKYFDIGLRIKLNQ